MAHTVSESLEGSMTAQPPLNPEALRDLYEACKAIDALDDGDESFAWQHEDIFELVHAAIAKAEQP
jgi:hypothetical protein